MNNPLHTVQFSENYHLQGENPLKVHESLFQEQISLGFVNTRSVRQNSSRKIGCRTERN